MISWRSGSDIAAARAYRHADSRLSVSTGSITYGIAKKQSHYTEFAPISRLAGRNCRYGQSRASHDRRRGDMICEAPFPRAPNWDRAGLNIAPIRHARFGEFYAQASMAQVQRVVTKAFTAAANKTTIAQYVPIPEGAIIWIDLKEKGYRLRFNYEGNEYTIDRDLIMNSTRSW